jgi:hypothetical protein
MDEKPVAKIMIQFDALHRSLCLDLVCLANERVRFQECESVIELYLERILPLAIGDVLHP